MGPYMHKDSIYHNAWYAGDYDQEKFGRGFGRILEIQEVTLFLSLLDVQEARILDLGAGTGKLSVPLLENGYQVVAGDASAEMLRQAHEKALSMGLNLDTEVCDATDLSFADQEFDHVVSSRMLMHLSFWRRGIAEMCRVSKKSVVLDFPPLVGHGGIGSLIRNIINPFLSENSHHRQKYSSFTLSEVVKEFQKNDFVVTRTHRQYFLPVGLHRIVDRPDLSMSIERLFRGLGLVTLFGAPVTVKAVRHGSR